MKRAHQHQDMKEKHIMSFEGLSRKAKIIYLSIGIAGLVFFAVTMLKDTR